MLDYIRYINSTSSSSTQYVPERQELEYVPDQRQELEYVPETLELEHVPERQEVEYTPDQRQELEKSHERQELEVYLFSFS